MSIHFNYYGMCSLQTTGSRLGVMTEAVAALITGIVIAFVFSWITTLLILLVIPVWVIAGRLSINLIWTFGRNSKKAYERAGSVCVYLVSHFEFSVDA